MHSFYRPGFGNQALVGKLNLNKTAKIPKRRLTTLIGRQWVN